MEHIRYDVLTGEPLTAENAMRCLDGYLQKIPNDGDIDRDIVSGLLMYLDYALSIKDTGLIYDMLLRINLELDGF